MTKAPKICSIVGCDRSAAREANGARGWCSKHYQRWKNHGDPHFTVTLPNGDRLRWLARQVSYAGDDCLTFPFPTRPDGYGIVTENAKHVRAHRWICQKVHGKPPPGKPHALHRCGNGGAGCVNPRHLYWGNDTDNQRDRILHGTSLRGERHPFAKLTRATVQSIRRDIADGKSGKDIAAAYGVTAQRVCDIKNGRAWTWLLAEA